MTQLECIHPAPLHLKVLSVTVKCVRSVISPSMKEGILGLASVCCSHLLESHHVLAGKLVGEQRVCEGTRV